MVGRVRDPGVIANRHELTRHGIEDLRALALRVADAGLRACDLAAATEAAVARCASGIRIAGQTYELDAEARVIVLGAGKGTLAIAVALEGILKDRIDEGAIIVRDGEDAIGLERIEILVADHPLPSERSVNGARRLTKLAAQARAGDLVIASFTGGSSALASLPPDGVTAEDKRHLHELLLGSGAPIADINAVRKHVSAFKGGRLAARVAPATLVNLTVSDVAGDVLDVLTDPSVEDGATVATAVGVLRERDLWDAVPASVRRHLESGAAESPRLGREPQTVLLVTGSRVCESMELEASAAGIASHVVSTELEGEAEQVGRMLAGIAVESAGAEEPVPPPHVLVGCGGESTVSLGGAGAFGAGGPNQEAAIGAALELTGDAAAACFLDTDGSDGGTEAAGGVVDGATATRAASARVDLEAALTSHRSGEALAALGDQIITGPTGTNVNDLFVLAVRAGSFP